METYKRKGKKKGRKKPPTQLEEEEWEEKSNLESLKSTKEGKKLSLQNIIEDIENNGN